MIGEIKRRDREGLVEGWNGSVLVERYAPSLNDADLERLAHDHRRWGGGSPRCQKGCYDPQRGGHEWPCPTLRMIRRLRGEPEL